MVQLSNSNPFGWTPVDQTTGAKVNKDIQSPRGTTRLSLKASSVKQFYLTAEYRSTFLVQGNNTELNDVELQCPRIQNDEKALSANVGLIQGWINLFAKKQDFVCIPTAKATPKDITSDLMKVLENQ